MRSFQNYFNILFTCLLLILLIVVAVLSYVPPVSRDALTHHLAIPKLWIEHGGIYEIPSLIFSYYPMNLDLLYWIPLYFGNDILPKYIHFLFALATAWLIYSYLRKRTNQSYALLGALLFLSTPVIVKLSISVYVDLGLIFFSWATIFFLFEWVRSLQSLKFLIYSAICCGLGLGTKYNGMIVLFLLTLSVPIMYIRAVGRDHFKIKYAFSYPILFLLISMTVFSPWMIRNYRLIENPIYPLYNNLIGSETNKSEISNMSMKPWLQRKLIYRESPLDTALIPIRIFFQGKDDNPRFFDGKLNPILFFFPCLILLARSKSDKIIKLEQLLLMSFSVLFLLYASFMVDMRIRYIAPIIPPLVVLTVFGIRQSLLWIDRIDRKGLQLLSQCIIVSIVLFFLFMNVKYVDAVFHSVDPVPYIAGEASRETYLRNKLPDYPAIQFANQIQNDHIKILALFLGKRLYYFDQPVEFGTQTFFRLVADTTSEMPLASHLKKNGFTHCIIGIGHFQQWANQVFANDQKKIVSQWLKDDCRLLFSENGYAVFDLIPNDVTRSTKHQKGNIK